MCSQGHSLYRRTMRFQQGTEHASLIVRSHTLNFGAILGAIVGVIGGLIGTSIVINTGILTGGGMPGAFVLHPLLFFVVAVASLGSIKKVHAVLRQHGDSDSTYSRWYGIQKDHQTFHSQEVEAIYLETQRRSTGGKNSTPYVISYISAGMRNGGEVLIGIDRRGGFFRREQLLLHEASQIAQFFNVPLHRSGYGAPRGYEPIPGGIAGPPETWGQQQEGPQPGQRWYTSQNQQYPQQSEQSPDGFNEPDSFGGVR